MVGKPKNLKLNIAYLYPRSMNIYGDLGNITALTKRLKWRKIEAQVDEIEVGQKFNQAKYDFVFAGGGQDRHQLRIAQDLQTKKIEIKKAVDRGVVFLLICGSYQLFGYYFKTYDNNKIPGISVFDAYTIASDQRKIGNVIIKLPSSLNLKSDTLVGFENHSGNTFIKKSDTQKLGRVVRGFGNNGLDKTEGARIKNCFGTYLHGSLLPKNPHLADYLIRLGLENKYKQPFNLEPINDALELKAHDFIITYR